MTWQVYRTEVKLKCGQGLKNRKEKKIASSISTFYYLTWQYLNLCLLPLTSGKDMFGENINRNSFLRCHAQSDTADCKHGTHQSAC